MSKKKHNKQESGRFFACSTPSLCAANGLIRALASLQGVKKLRLNGIKCKLPFGALLLYFSPLRK
jgi:hypothetical protein